jgi:hypothetical protein
MPPAAESVAAQCLLCLAAGFLSSFFADAVAAQQSPKTVLSDSTRQVHLSVDRERVRVESGGELFAAYDFSSHRKPILYPLHGPGGTSMTRHFPMREGIAGEQSDHVHHKSIWFAHGNVNGLDFWGEKARIVNRGVELIQADGASWPGLVATNEWLDGERPLLVEIATIRFCDLGEIRIVDFEFSLTAQVDVRLGDTKEGTFAIRTHPNLQLKRDDATLPTGHAANSVGESGAAIWGRRADWVCYYGEIDGRRCGIAMFDHPDNVRHPTTWHARDYGLVAANPFGLHDFLGEPPGTGDLLLPRNQSLKLRYSIAAFRGDYDPTRIAGLYQDYRRRSRSAGFPRGDEKNWLGGDSADKLKESRPQTPTRK